MEVLKIVAYRDSHHIPTWVSVAKRLSSSDYFYPDGSPFCHSSRSSSNGNRSACLRHKQACSNKTPPLVFAHGFGHKKRAPIHPRCGTNRRSMLIHSWAHGHGRESLLLQEEITNDHAFLVSFLFTINAASAAAEWWYTPYP